MKSRLGLKTKKRSPKWPRYMTPREISDALPPRNWREVVTKDAAKSPTLRVGFTPEQNLIWLLRFIQRADLATLKPNSIAQSEAASELCQFWAAQQSATYPEKKLPAPPRAHDVAHFATRVMEGLKSLLSASSGRRWLQQAPGDLATAAWWDGSKSRSARIAYLSRSVTETALWRAQLLLAEHVHRITKCHRKACPKFFLVHKRAKFCSPQCASLEHVSAYMSRLSPEQREYLLRKAYLQRHQRTDRRVDRDRDTTAAAERYLKRVERTDPAMAARLRKDVIEKKKESKSRSRGARRSIKVR